jgi:hypothetical protein
VGFREASVPALHRASLHVRVAHAPTQLSVI